MVGGATSLVVVMDSRGPRVAVKWYVSKSVSLVVMLSFSDRYTSTQIRSVQVPDE